MIVLEGNEVYQLPKVKKDELIICYRKSRRAQSREDYETWVESDMANTLNTFDNGDVRTTTIIVEKR